MMSPGLSPGSQPKRARARTCLKSSRPCEREDTRADLLPGPTPPAYSAAPRLAEGRASRYDRTGRYVQLRGNPDWRGTAALLPGGSLRSALRTAAGTRSRQAKRCGSAFSRPGAFACRTGQSAPATRRHQTDVVEHMADGATGKHLRLRPGDSTLGRLGQAWTRRPVANMTPSPTTMPVLTSGVRIFPLWYFIMGRILIATCARAPAPSPRRKAESAGW